MAIDTILLSFCEDVDKNNGTDKPYFMPESLRSMFSCIINIIIFI